MKGAHECILMSMRTGVCVCAFESVNIWDIERDFKVPPLGISCLAPLASPTVDARRPAQQSTVICQEMKDDQQGTCSPNECPLMDARFAFLNQLSSE